MLRDVRVMVLDKTGTLTEGQPAITDVIAAAGFTPERLVALAAAVERSSEHPLARAVVRKADGWDFPAIASEEFEAIPGKGARARANGENILVGKEALLQECGIETSGLRADAAVLEEAGETTLWVAVDGVLAGILALSDTLKPHAKELIQTLRAMGITPILLTGDQARIALPVAKTLGIDRVYANVLPADKARRIREIQETCGVTAMVGDGINDAAALAQADVGIAIGAGADVAIESAGIVLVQADLAALVNAIRLARAIFTKIRQNLFWAIGYNVLAIPLAMLGLLHPLIAEAAMAVSSINVITNSLRLRRFRPSIFGD